jgi:murein L,D-transpeptidase YafK
MFRGWVGHRSFPCQDPAWILRLGILRLGILRLGILRLGILRLGILGPGMLGLGMLGLGGGFLSPVHAAESLPPGLEASSEDGQRTPAKLFRPTRTPEHHLMLAVDHWLAGRVDTALSQLRELLRQQPDFSLGQELLRALQTPAPPPLTIVSSTQPGGATPSIPLPGASPSLPFPGQLATLPGLRPESADELLRRWRHHHQPPPAGQVPDALLRLGENHPIALMVDMEQARLYVVQNLPEGPHILEDYYVSYGAQGAGKQREGDLRTPIGVYFTVEHIPGQRLPDRYGWGAFTLNYPNFRDRHLRRTGYGIWLHGNPTGSFSRPPQDSEGCVTLHNDDLAALAPWLQAGRVPVLLLPRLHWVAPADQAAAADELLATLEAWRADWERLDMPRYLQHYSKDFRNRRYTDLHMWQQEKIRVHARKTQARISLTQVNAFRYPDPDSPQDLVLVTFQQDYWSDNFASLTDKQQLWQREADGQWRILFEDTFP